MTFEMRAVGYVRGPYADTAQIPKGRGAKHEAEGAIELLPEFEPGLADIEGFSHLYVIWAFHRAEGYELVGATPTDARPHGRRLAPLGHHDLRQNPPTHRRRV